MSTIPDSTPSSVDCAIRAVIERIDAHLRDSLKRNNDNLKRTEDLLARMEVLADAWSAALSDRKEPPLDTVH